MKISRCCLICGKNITKRSTTSRCSHSPSPSSRSHDHLSSPSNCYKATCNIPLSSHKVTDQLVSPSSPPLCKSCYQIWRTLPKLIEKRCPCGNHYHVNLYELVNNFHLTCSDKCYNEFVRKSMPVYERLCPRCKAHFKTYDEFQVLCCESCGKVSKLRDPRRYISKAINRLI